MVRLATVFSGIGAIEQALKQMGIEHEIVFACDNGERYLDVDVEDIKKEIKKAKGKETAEEVVSRLYDETGKINNVKKSYFANYKIDEDRWFEDIRFVDGKPFKGQVDLFVGGSPCQSFSTYGHRKGLEDTRGTLFYDYARLVKEIQPKAFIFENVTGLLNHDNGKTWDVIRSTFKSLKYDIKMDILDAKDYNLPQLRKRVFVVGIRRDLKCPKFQFPLAVELTHKSTEYLDAEVDDKYYLGEKGFNFVNAAAIFGDLFQLLDRNDKKGKSRYRINNTDIAGFFKKDKRLASLFVNDKIWLPSNFNIVCTMNTADQNVFVLDSAFKRRFSEEYTAIDFSKLTKELKEATTVFNGTTDLQQLFANTNLKNFIDKLAENGDLNRDWPTFAKIVNYIIDDINEESGSEQISEDKKLGPFFVSVKDLESRKNFINKVLHYLKQDVFKYVDFYFTESYQTIHSKYINETADIFNLLKRQGE